MQAGGSPALARRIRALIISTACSLSASTALAQGITGTVRDQTGGILPSVTVEAHGTGAAASETTTDTAGVYRLNVPAGRYELVFSLVNFAAVRRAVEVSATGGPRLI